MQLRRRIIPSIYFLALVCIILSFLPVYANENTSNLQGAFGDFIKSELRIEINGQMISDARGAIISGRSMVPLKTVTKELGISTSWFSSSKIIRIDDKNGPIFLKIGDSEAVIGGKPIQLDVPPTIEGGQTLVPLRFLAEALQAQIEWLPDQKLVRMHRSELKGVRFERYPEQLRVIFDLNTPESYKIFRLTGPDRLVVDFPGTSYLERKSSTVVNHDLLRFIRVSLFQENPLMTRAVLDLEDPNVEYKVYPLTAQEKLVIDIIPQVESDLITDNEFGQPWNGVPLPLNHLLQNKIIVVDPGHGGRNPGAIGISGLYESEVNYDVAVRVNEMLRDAGAYTIMTRESNEDPSLLERTELSNDNRADLFISIHADAHPKESTRGSTVYGHYNATEENWALAWYVHDEIIKLTGLESKGLRAADFVVLRETKAPAILIEMAYLTNPEDESLLKNEEFRQKMAQGIFNGILRYFE